MCSPMELVYAQLLCCCVLYSQYTIHTHVPLYADLRKQISAPLNNRIYRKTVVKSGNVLKTPILNLHNFSITN